MNQSEYPSRQPEYRKLVRKKWLEKHPAYRADKVKEWKQNNQDKVKAYRLTDKYRAARARYFNRRRGATGTHATQEWIDLKKIYGNKCVRCGEKEYPGHALTIDHKIPISLGGTHNIDNIQPLCARCNSSKGATIWFAQCKLNQ
jgi:5-methylcytosine-specific restriction endonuclease McrA